MKNKRLGNQNPTQSVKIPYSVTKGKEAITLYENGKFKAMQWQKNMLDDLLAINEDGLWTHTKFGYSVPRRNGKNEIVLMRELFALMNGEQVLHTAHRVNTGTSAWERLIRQLESSGYVQDEDFEILRAKGNERVEFLSTGGRVQFRTRTSTGGLGEGFDLLVIDEAQEYTEDQQSALKYVVSSSQNPQTLFCGTPPTMVSSGTVFTQLRERALAGNSKNTAWFEWSVDSETNPHDIEAWYKTNPSLGTVFTERIIEDEVGDDELDFNIQRLGYWVTYNQKSVISEKDWDELKVNSTPYFKSGIYAGIKYGVDGKNVSLSIAVKTLSNRIYVESIDCRPIRNGNQWIINWLLSMDIEKVIVDGAGNQSLLKNEMKDYRLKDPILPSVKEVIIANSKFEQAIYNKEVFHNGQPSLREVVTNCEKRAIGTQGGFGFKSQYEDKDITLMDSCILAYFICSEEKQIRQKQKVYY